MISPALLQLAMPLVLLVAFFLVSVKVVAEYERLVVLLLGRFQEVKNPGLRIVVPGIHRAFRVDLRVITMDIPPQDVISHDNVTVRVNAVLYFRVVDPKKAIIQVEDYLNATNQLAQTTLRSVLGQHELDEMLSERDKLNSDIQTIIDRRSDAWGIKVINVEIKHIDLNESMVRAIARQAEAERERRAKVIHAEGEYQAAQKLLAAADIIARNSQAMQLRYLQTLSDISNQQNSSTIVFPFPVEMLARSLQPRQEEKTGAVDPGGEGRKLAENGLATACREKSTVQAGSVSDEK
ncbi:MAG: slipin family protein [Desulfopila sp.]